MGKQPFDVVMHFNYTEYVYFKYWYENTCKMGTLSFSFPKIDGTSGSGNEDYCFADGGAPTFRNLSGAIIECNMKWEIA